jgi:hypothetical protein
MGFVEETGELYKSFPVLKKEKSPQVAAALGFFFGGVGLGLYFWSFVDFILPILITVVLSFIITAIAEDASGTAWLVGASIAGVYGYLRADNSNRRRKAGEE